MSQKEAEVLDHETQLKLNLGTRAVKNLPLAKFPDADLAVRAKGISCKLDVAATAGLTVDQPIKRCISDEQKARQQLASQWSKFPASNRASCTADESVGGTPSYVSLLTCLQMSQWAR